MKFLYAVSVLLLIFSFIKNREKTGKALKIAWKKFAATLTPFIVMIIFVSIALFFVPQDVIVKYLSSDSKWLSLFFASFFGSISVMPGFIAFPLSGILLKNGVSYMAVSAFTTTLMMVGVITFPVEKAYIGTKAAVLRNIISLFLAIVTALTTAFFYGELF